MYINITWVLPLFFGYHVEEPDLKKVEVDETAGEHLAPEEELVP